MGLPTTLPALDFAHAGQPFFHAPGNGTIDTMPMDYARHALPFVSNPASYETKGTSWMIFDESNTFDVVLRSGALASAADDLAVLNGANLCLLGSELVQFKTVTSLGLGKYRLSSLLRGRFGTEWAMTAHAAGERFVVLTESTVRRLPGSLDDIGIGRFWRAVSAGQVLAAAMPTYAIDTGVALKPYAPVHVTGSRDGSQNLTISWIRRTRLAGGWRDFVDAALSEGSESYETDILNGSGAVVRTLASTTPSVVYTAAQQTTDFGATQSAVAVITYQRSASVGRGYGRSATV